MAWKSPGIYYTEIDNTEYTNPAAEINTTVAIIGFAKKGPINEPTEITSWTQFKSTFGSPITGDFAPIAVRNVLSNGGTVLFVRIADESLASQSAVVLKTEQAATDGKLIFNRTSIPGTELKTNGFYKALVKKGEEAGAEERLIYFRTPEEGYLSSYSMLEQFQACLTDYYGFSEYSFKTSKKATDDNWRFFSFKFNDLQISEDAADTIGTKNNVIGPFAVKLTAAKAVSGASLADEINTSIANGTVPYLMFDLNSIYYRDSDGNANPLTLEGFTESSEIESFDAENGLYFNFTVNNNLVVQNKTYGETIIINDKTYAVKFTTSDGKLYLKDIVSSLNNTLNTIEIAVKPVIGTTTDSDGRIVPSVKLLFFKTDTSAEDTEITGGNLLKYYGDTDSINATTIAEELSENQPVTLVLIGSTGKFSSKTAIGIAPVEASYNSDSNTIIFQVISSTLIADEKDSTVTLEDPGIGSYLSQSTSDTETYYLTNSNAYAIGSLVRTIPGQLASSFSIRKNSKGVIEIYVSGQKDHPVIAEDNSVSGEDLISLFDSVEEYSDDTSTLDSILYKDGVDAESASEHARLGFIAKEYGEGTTDIGIEIYTSVSPLDNTTKTHYLDIYISGIKKETYEDISYNPNDDNFIVTLLNQDPMNGGSSYVTAVYSVGTSGDEELDIQDTATYTEDGIVYLGQNLYDDGKAANTSTNLSSLERYDYAVGNNGIVENSTDLYLNALETENSPLSNKDLYSWYILITPDNISAEVQDQAITLCEYMDDAIYIADPPEALTRKAVINWHNGRLGNSDRVSALNSNFCCTYWPWVKIYDSSSSKYVWAPPSVVMAPQFVKVDNSYAPWYAPAGETNGLIATAIDIEESPNKTDRDALYLDQNRVNPFLKLRNGNILAYGEKTCQRKNSTLTKIHTRRMLIALKKELRNSIKGYIFMPTMTENITEIKSKVTAIMESYKQGGGVDSYVVVCDGTNNTTETLQQDILNVDISCVPVGCLEQVNISLQLNKSAESTE